MALGWPQSSRERLEAQVTIIVILSNMFLAISREAPTEMIFLTFRVGRILDFLGHPHFDIDHCRIEPVPRPFPTSYAK